MKQGMSQGDIYTYIYIYMVGVPNEDAGPEKVKANINSLDGSKPNLI